MQIFTAKSIKMMGEADAKYGQTYFGGVEEIDYPVRFNLMSQENIWEGRKLIAGEAEQRKSTTSGKYYMQLKKVKLGDSVAEAEEIANAPATPATQTPSKTATDYEPGTNARWALRLSVDTYKAVVGGMPTETGDYTQIEGFARWLLAAFDRLKSNGTQVVAEAGQTPLSGDEASQSEQSAVGQDLDNLTEEDEAAYM